MKWLVTAIAMTSRSRRRAGKSWTEVFESESDHPRTVEERYEQKWNLEHPNETCKVIDVRVVEDENTVTFTGRESRADLTRRGGRF